MEVWKIIFLSKWVICRFHVNLPGCSGGFKDFLLFTGILRKMMKDLTLKSFKWVPQPTKLLILLHGVPKDIGHQKNHQSAKIMNVNSRESNPRILKT